MTGDPIRSVPSDIRAGRHNARAAADLIADCPVDEAQGARLLALYTDRRNVLAGLHHLAKLPLLQSTPSIRHQAAAEIMGRQPA